MGYHVRLIHEIDFDIEYRAADTVTTLGRFSPSLAIITKLDEPYIVSLRRLLQVRNAYGCHYTSMSMSDIKTAHNSGYASINDVLNALKRNRIPVIFMTNAEYSNHIAAHDRCCVDVQYTTYYFSAVEDFGSLERLSQHDA